jgi:hypothetical protein
MATPLPARMQNSRPNDGRIFLIFMADPRTVRLCRFRGFLPSRLPGSRRLRSATSNGSTTKSLSRPAASLEAITSSRVCNPHVYAGDGFDSRIKC